jgi:hypothetical protein
MTANYNNDEEEKEKRKIALYFIWCVILAMALIAIVGCKEIQYVEKPVVHTEYIYRDRVDSAFVHDSIYIKEQIKGDTIRITEYRYKDRFRYIYAIDTLVQRDTIPIVHTEVVEKIVARMNSLQSAFFWLGLLAFLSFVGYVVYKLLKQRFFH